jgi:hypothetical protein
MDKNDAETVGQLADMVEKAILAHSDEIKAIKKRSDLIKKANKEVFASNKKVFDERSMLYENHADNVSDVLLSEEGISKELQSELEKLVEVSRSAVGASYDELKELRAMKAQQQLRN